MRLLPIITIIMSCGLIENNKKNKNPLFVAAQDAGFLRDQQVASDVERFNKKIVEAKYIESLMVGRVSVGISEITNYYETNKNQFVMYRVKLLSFLKLNSLKLTNFFIQQ